MTTKLTQKERLFLKKEIKEDISSIQNDLRLYSHLNMERRKTWEFEKQAYTKLLKIIKE